MDLWDISKDVFDSLIQDISAKAVADEEEENVAAAAAEEENILKVLPVELLLHIFQFLEKSDLYTVRLVCKEFNEAATSPQVFKLHLKEAYLDIKEFEVEVIQPLLKNFVSVNLYCMREEESEDLEKLFKKLEEQFTSLKILKISYGCIPSNITIENIVEKLEEILIMSVEFKNAAHFFRTTSENPAYRNLEKFELFSCTGIGDNDVAPFEGFSVAPMRKLQVLSLNDVQVIGDREYLHLKESMANVTTLVLSNTTLNLETFQQLDLRKLTNLNVTQCQASNDWLSALKNLVELDKLCLSGVTITDTCYIGTFKKLDKIKWLNITDCNFGNRTVGAVAAHLPNLVTWEMMPSEDGNVTDTALNNLVIHKHLETIMFDRVQFGGYCLRQIARCAPALKHLTLVICAANDDDMDIFKDCFTHLIKLNLTGLRITDVGLAKLQPRLGLLEEVQIESRLVTGPGMSTILPLLTSATCLDIKFGDPQSCFSYTRCTDDSYNQIYMCGPGITRDIMMHTNKIYNANVLRFESLTLGTTELHHFVESQPRTDNLTITTCTLDEQTTEVILRDFINLANLSLYQCHLTMPAFVKLFEGIRGKEMNTITIENEIMLDEETLVSVVPKLVTVSDINIHTLDYMQHLNISNNSHCKEFSLLGMPHVKDETFVALMKSNNDVMNLAVTDTSVTDKGFAEVAELLTKVTYMRIKSKVIGDETMEVIGKHFSDLKTLTVESEIVTDVGLEALGKHYENLESLTVIHSDITDEGIKKIAPLLKVATNLDLYTGNKKVTAELLAYMRETYPNITHTEPESEEVAEDEPYGYNDVADGAVQLEVPNDVEVVEGQPEGAAAEPIQPEVQNVDAEVPAQPEEPNDVAVNQVQPEEVNEVAVESPEHNEAATECETPKEQNSVVEESESKNSDNLERRPSQMENDVPIELPQPQPVEGHNEIDVAPEQSEEQNGVDLVEL